MVIRQLCALQAKQFLCKFALSVQETANKKEKNNP